MRIDIRRQRGLLPPDRLPIPRDPPRPPADKVESLEQPLIYEFPTYSTVPFGFVALDVPAGLTIGADKAAWYGLQRVNVDADTGQEVYLTGFTLEQAPGDTGGAGDLNRFPAATFVSWGEVSGCASSYIVIGQNLPMNVGAWSAGPANWPGLLIPASGSSKAISSTILADVRAFPTPLGNINAAGSGRRVIVENTAPMAIRLPQGSKLDVAFVAVRTGIHSLGGAAKVFGFVYGELKLGRRIAGASFST